MTIYSRIGNSVAKAETVNGELKYYLVRYETGTGVWEESPVHKSMFDADCVDEITLETALKIISRNEQQNILQK